MDFYIEGSPCPDCKTGKMRDGKLFGGMGMGLKGVVFVPSIKSIWKESYRRLDAWACDNCGFISFRVRVKPK